MIAGQSALGRVLIRMLRRRISSSLTFVYKFVFPVFWTVAAMNVVRYTLNGALLADPVLLFLSYSTAALGLTHSARLFLRVKNVEVDLDYFYVSNYRKEVTIPITHVIGVTEMRWMDPFCITLHLDRPSDFGDKVVFVPPYRFFAFWLKNPLTSELKELAASKRSSRFRPPDGIDGRGFKG